MFKKVLLISSVLALMLVFGAGAALADGDDEDTTCPPVYNADDDIWVTSYYCDGRLNAFDPMQTVAVYYGYDSIDAWDDDGNPYTTEVISDISLWVIDWNGTGQLALQVPAAQIEKAVTAGSSTIIAEANGVSLGYSAYGVLWAAGPGGYTFTWNAW